MSSLKLRNFTVKFPCQAFTNIFPGHDIIKLIYIRYQLSSAIDTVLKLPNASRPYLIANFSFQVNSHEYQHKMLKVSKMMKVYVDETFRYSTSRVSRVLARISKLSAQSKCSLLDVENYNSWISSGLLDNQWISNGLSDNQWITSG